MKLSNDVTFMRSAVNFFCKCNDFDIPRLYKVRVANVGQVIEVTG